MDNTITQIFILCACIFSGIISGGLYELFYIIRRTVKLKAVRIIADTMFFIGLALIFICIAVVFNFPKLRAFMILGVLLGLLLYIVSLHRIVAFLIKKLYNIIKKLFLHNKKGSGKTDERGKN